MTSTANNFYGLSVDNVKLYQRIVDLMGKSDVDDQWLEIMKKEIGWDRVGAAPMPLLAGSEAPSPKAVVLAHMAFFKGFLTFVMSSRCSDVPLAIIEEILEAYRSVALSGGWAVYWSSVTSMYLFIHAIKHLTVEPSKGSTWANLQLKDEYKHKEVFDINTWLSEVSSIYNFAEAIMSEIDSIEDDDNDHRVLYYHSDGYASLMPRGSVYCLRALSNEEIELIRLYGGDVVIVMSDRYKDLQEVVSRLKDINIIEIKTLMATNWDGLIGPLLAYRGLKLLNQAVAMRCFEENTEFKANFESIDPTTLLDKLLEMKLTFMNSHAGSKTLN